MALFTGAFFVALVSLTKGDSKERIKGRIVDLKTTILYWAIQNRFYGRLLFFFYSSMFYIFVT